MSDAERRQQMRDGAQRLIMLFAQCPALFAFVLPDIPEDVWDSVYEIANSDDEDTDHAAN